MRSTVHKYQLDVWGSLCIGWILGVLALIFLMPCAEHVLLSGSKLISNIFGGMLTLIWIVLICHKYSLLWVIVLNHFYLMNQHFLVVSVLESLVDFWWSDSLSPGLFLCFNEFRVELFRTFSLQFSIWELWLRSKSRTTECWGLVDGEGHLMEAWWDSDWKFVMF